MGKKNRNKKVKIQSAAVSSQPKPVINEKKLEIPAFWIAVIIPVICFVGAWTYPPVATPMELKSYASQIYLSGLLLLWFWMHRKKHTVTLTFSPVRVAFALLFVAGTLSLLWAVNPDFWVYKWNKWFAGMVMFLLGLQITQNEKSLDTIVNLVIIGGLIVAAIGIGQYLFGLDIVPQTAFPSSTFGNGNMAGQVMVLTAVLPLYFLFKKDLTSGQTWYYSIAMSLLLTYMFYTRTRAVWMACGLEAILILLFIVLDRKRRQDWLAWNRKKTKTGLAGLALFVVLINFNQDGFQPFWEIAMYEISSISTAIASDASQTGGERYLIWSSAAEMIKDNPVIGTGLGSFFDNVNRGDYQLFRIIGVQRAHNDVLELMVELGSLGLLLLLGIIVTMCVLLYKLILRSEGQRRILYALLTIAVTGSMFNAQLSFPYQLPVPLVIMPFYLALLVRGSEDIEKNTRTVTLQPWFNKLAISTAAVIFAFITINDLTWMRDVHMMNRIVSGRINEPWKPANPIYNQVYLTGSRSVAQALRGTGRDNLSLNVITPILDYWPNSTANSFLAAEIYMNTGNFEQAEIWIDRTLENQMAHSYLGEYYRMELLQRTGNVAGLSELYESMKAQPESSLSQFPNTYNMLHSMAINLQDYDMVTHFYEKSLEYHGEQAPLIANHAIYYINIGNIPAAIPYMHRALELNPDFSMKDQFEQLMAQYPSYLFSQPE